MDMNLTDSEQEYLRSILNDFEHCVSKGFCENCKAYEKLKGTQCTVCELLLTYINDISNAMNKLIDKM